MGGTDSPLFHEIFDALFPLNVVSEYIILRDTRVLARKSLNSFVSKRTPRTRASCNCEYLKKNFLSVCLKYARARTKKYLKRYCPNRWHVMLRRRQLPTSSHAIYRCTRFVSMYIFTRSSDDDDDDAPIGSHARSSLRVDTRRRDLRAHSCTLVRCVTIIK